MSRLRINWLAILVPLIVLTKLSEARAKADIWGDDDDDDEDDWWGKNDSSGGKDDPPAAASRSNDNVVPVAVATPPSHQVQNTPTDQRQRNWDSHGYQGGTFASHNESCSPSRSCVRNANMECSTTDGTGLCQCIGGWVYVRATESCWKIVVSSQEECAHDVQCQHGRWGHLSRCNKQTARCECHDWSGYNRETVRSEDGICFIKKIVGDLCNTHEECDEPIQGEAYCQYEQYVSSWGKPYKGSCQCKETSTWYKPSEKCLLKSTKLGDPCEVSDQCRVGTLDKLSTCDRDTQKCVCMFFGGALNNTEVIYYEKLKKCFIKKDYNDTCIEDDQCRANLGPDVECGPTEYSDEDVCHCSEGKVCRRNNTEEFIYHRLKIIAGIVAAATVFVAICSVLWFFSPVCNSGKKGRTWCSDKPSQNAYANINNVNVASQDVYNKQYKGNERKILLRPGFNMNARLPSKDTGNSSPTFTDYNVPSEDFNDEQYIADEDGIALGSGSNMNDGPDTKDSTKSCPTLSDDKVVSHDVYDRPHAGNEGRVAQGFSWVYQEDTTYPDLTFPDETVDLIDIFDGQPVVDRLTNGSGCNMNECAFPENAANSGLTFSDESRAKYADIKEFVSKERQTSSNVMRTTSSTSLIDVEETQKQIENDSNFSLEQPMPSIVISNDRQGNSMGSGSITHREDATNSAKYHTNEDEYVCLTNLSVVQPALTDTQGDVQTTQDEIECNSDTDDVLGKGASSVVYKGKYGNRRVAVKKISRISRNMEGTADKEIQFFMDCRTHNNIATLYHTKKKRERLCLKYYLAIEFCETTLKKCIEEKISAISRVQILHQICLGLQYIHSKSIIHRDLKPENILLTDVTENAVVKITDFGISNKIQEGATHFTVSTGSGTTDWKCPEILQVFFMKQRVTLTPKADIFNLGCIFYYVFTGGKLPFSIAPILEGSYKPELNLPDFQDGTLYYNYVRLIKLMILYHPGERPTVDNILKHHHIFWDFQRKLDFLTTVSNFTNSPRLKKMEECLRKYHRDWADIKVSNMDKIFSAHEQSATNPLAVIYGIGKRIVKNAPEVPIGWQTCLSPTVREIIKKSASRPYQDGKSVIELIKAFRNLFNHLLEKPMAGIEEVGRPPKEYFLYWHVKERFPFLFDLVWTAFIKCWQDELNAKVSQPSSHSTVPDKSEFHLEDMYKDVTYCFAKSA